MKTTKIFLMAALALTFAACSNDDNDIQSPAEQTAKAEGIPFTATISVANSATTRALAITEYYKIEATWAEGEKVALIHNGVSDVMEVESVSGGVATIKGTITGSPKDGDAVTVIYPSTAADGTTGNIKADLLYAQDGTLTGTSGTSIAEKYDVRKSSGAKLKVVSGTASLDGNVSLTNQFAIFKFDVKNADATAPINVKPLTITIGAQDYVITPALATSELYAALPAISDQAVTFTATGSDSKTYTASKASVTFAAGNYYQSTLKMAPVFRTVTWNPSDIVPEHPWDDSFTKDGITFTAATCDFQVLTFGGGGTFTTTLGNFTKIEISADYAGDVSGTGWSNDGWQSATWTGNAASVSFSGDIWGGGMTCEGGNLKIVFTIE